MFDIISEMGETLIFNIVQLIAGCILAWVLYHFLNKKVKPTEGKFVKDLCLAVLFIVIGMILPLGSFGIIPIMAALMILGFKPYIILPMFVSSTIFNILISFNDISFVWRTGYRRVILAFVIGLAFVFILKISKISVRLTNFPKFEDNKINFKGIASIAGDMINKLGIFLVVGIVADTLFNTYVLPGIIDAIFKSASFIPKYFGSLNVVNPFFILAITLVKAIFDLTRLSALISFFKPKGFIIYYAGLTAFTVLLAATAFTNI